MRYLSKLVKAIFTISSILLLLTSCSSGEATSSNFSNSERTFADMMIPHHSQAIEISELAIAKSKNSAILALAQKIKAAQTPEIEQMKLWSESKDSAHMGHEMTEDGAETGHSMMGMLDETEILKLEDAQGVEFDRLFLQGMIQHHEGAIGMAEMIVNSENAEAKALGKAIIKGQSSEVTEMKALLTSLS